MKIIKRDGTEQTFSRTNIIEAIGKANQKVRLENRLTNDEIKEISKKIEEKCKAETHALNVEDIQEMVENEIILNNKPDLAREYITYRYMRAQERQKNTIDDKILSLLDNDNEEIKQENANKNPTILNVQRDYMAGEVSKDITRRYLMPEDIWKAHIEGIIHFHDADYFANKMYNCCLANLEDCLQNGTVLRGRKINKPHRFSVACTIASQIAAIISSSQYGGQTFNVAHLSPFVEESRISFRKRYASLKDKMPEEEFDNFIENCVKDDVKDGIQTINYQLNTVAGTNGQSPFISLFMYLDDVPEGRERDDLAMVCNAILEQRIQGLQNEQGTWVPPEFPKLLYVLDEDNIWDDSPYLWLTKKAIDCNVARMVPDYISAKKMKELKEGNVFGCMGAARGDETVSIKIGEAELNNITIKSAFEIIRETTKKDLNYCKNTIEVSKGKIGVYKIEHKDGKFYIGSSKNIGRRITEHRYSIRHKGTLGDNYLLNDYNVDNYKFSILEECDIDNLLETESKWFNALRNDNCVNFKDPIDNGNFEKEMSVCVGNKPKEVYSTYTNKAYTWFKKIERSDIFVKSNNEWVPIRAITYNVPECELDNYCVSYVKDGEIKNLYITEDHPLHTQRGRVIARELSTNDKVIDCINGTEYDIVCVERIEERFETYDFEVDNDMFDLSGILSHNCRSFLQPYYEDKNGNPSTKKKGKPKFWGRFNQGVVTLNLPDVALCAKGDIEKFWLLLDDRLELCHRALRLRHERLRGTPSDVAPELWQHGIIARLKPGETIDKLLYNDYSSISLGFVGLYECVKALTGKPHYADEDSIALGKAIMNRMNEKCSQWKQIEKIGYSIYGTPEESTTYKFAKALQKRHGIIPGVTDKNYVTNSYHVHVTEKINAFDKLTVESQFQELSTGGAISYVEANDISNNKEAVLDLLRHMYNTIMYSEINLHLSNCLECGFSGRFEMPQVDGKIIWRCPSCGCVDQEKLKATIRVCGYIASNTFNQGRMQEVEERVTHF